MSLPALYQLAEEYRQLAERLYDLDLPEQAIADTLEAESGALQVKVANVAMVARNMEASAKSIYEAAQAMYLRADRLMERAERLRDYLLHNMQRAGIEQVDSPYFTIKRRRNPAKVDIFDADQLPNDVMRYPDPPPPAPDKKLIAERLKAGAEVPGARLVQDERLEIK